MIQINSTPSKKGNKKLLNNIFSLGALQIASYLLPLITVPYLIRVIGMENYGLLAFISAFTMYFLLISDYGFNLSATKQISDNRDCHVSKNRIFNEVLIVKLILTLICFFVLNFLMFFQFFNQHALIYYLTFGMVVGQALFPIWFFQGIEEMRHVTIVNIILKTILAFSTFIFIENKKDYWIVPLLTSLSFILPGVYALIFVQKKFNIKLGRSEKCRLIFQLKSGWHVFITRIYSNLYSTTNIILLGLFTNNTLVGNYSIAEKIIQAISGVFGPIIQAFFPYLASRYTNSKGEFFNIFKKLNLIFLTSSLMLSLAIIFMADFVVLVMTGGRDVDVVNVFSILAISIITAPFGPLLTNAMIIINEEVVFAKVMLESVMLNFLLALPLIYLYDAIGLSFVYVSVQIYMVIKLSIIFKRLASFSAISSHVT